jgi:hypothetical protein
LEGSRYCAGECLERAVNDLLHRPRSIATHNVPSHRIPLGLLLLSRQHLTIEQLRTALAAQQKTGRGRLGEWVQALGFTGEQQVTAAVARQWSCPVLRMGPSILPAQTSVQHLPAVLLEKFSMVPVNFVAATATLHLAFSESVDYSVLYAIEQMTGCHTEPCMAVPSFVRARLEALAKRRSDSAVIFDCVADAAEMSRIVCSYSARLGACEIRMAECRPYLWVRILRPKNSFLDILLYMPEPAL